MKLGISIELYKMEELEEKVSTAVACGFEFCQMFLRKVEISEVTVNKVADVCKSYGLKIGPVGAYANPLRPNDEQMGWTMNKVKKMIEFLPILGSNEIVLWSGTKADDLLAYKAGNFGKEALREVIRISEQVLELLQDMDGTLTFEPYYTHVLHDVPSIHSLLHNIQSERIKIIIDPPNYISPDDYDSRDEKMVELLDSLHAHIGAVHFKDFRLLPDRSWDYPGPGGGIMNYPLLIKKLDEYGYSSWGIIEHVGPAEYASAKAFLEAQLR
ncbi:MAG: sugar phosphate isomerase/epimerase family protein [Ignavibacteriaceae bacterium]